MRLKSSYDPFSVEYESGVGPVLILAFLLGLAGIFIASIPFFAQAENIRKSGLVYCMIGAGFILVAIAVAFLRKGLKIDTSSGEMTKWFGFSEFIFHKSMDHLKNYAYVRISRQEHRTKNGVYYSYPISLAPEKGKGFQLENFNDPLKSRLFAENSAALLKISLLDASEQIQTIRSPDELNMSVRKRAEKHGDVPKINELGEIPSPISGFVSLKNRHLEIKMPENFRAKFKAFILIAVLAVGFTMSGIMVFIITSSIFRKSYLPLIFLLAEIPAFILIALVIFKKSLPEDVTMIYASPERLDLHYGNKKVEINADEIEEILLLPPPVMKTPVPEYFKNFIPENRLGGILLRTDKANVRFGGRFGNSESKWIYSALYAILASPLDKSG